MSYFDLGWTRTFWKCVGILLLLLKSSRMWFRPHFPHSSCCFNHRQIEDLGVHLHEQECWAWSL